MYVAWPVLLTLFDLSTVGAAEVVADVMVVSDSAEAPFQVYLGLKCFCCIHTNMDIKRGCRNAAVGTTLLGIFVYKDGSIRSKDVTL